MSIWMWVLYTGLLTIILLLIITIIYYYYAKQKAIDVLSIQKWKIMNFKKFILKILLVIIPMIIELEDFDFDNVLIGEESHKNILIYYISNKTSIDLKPFRTRFDGYIRISDGTRYLVLLGPEANYAIYNRSRYIISLKSSITYIFSHYFIKIKIGSYDSFPIEKILTLHNVMIFIKSVLDKDKNHYFL